MKSEFMSENASAFIACFLAVDVTLRCHVFHPLDGRNSRESTPKSGMNVTQNVQKAAGAFIESRSADFRNCHLPSIN
jgi:hypothetical protein